MKKKDPHSFVKMYLNLGYLFDHHEIFFLCHMVQIDFIRESGYRTSFSRDFMLKKLKMNTRVFKRCTNRFLDMGLLAKKRQGLHYDYLLNQELYNRLIDILCVTNDILALSEFCEREFIRAGRKIGSITNDEIKELKKQGEANKQKWL